MGVHDPVRYKISKKKQNRTGLNGFKKIKSNQTK